MLNTNQVSTSHTAQTELMAITDKWSITEKVVCAVTDNASKMTAVIKLTPWKLFPCFTDAIKLIVQNALSSYTEIVSL